MSGFRSLAARSSAFAIAVVLHANVQAQDVPVEVASNATPTPSANGAPIVVTGSRIERLAEDSSVPLQVLTADDLREAGRTDLAEIMTQIPGVGDGISPQNSNNSIQNAGLSTISLRRLGDNRTLTLINGKRAVSNSGNGDRVSLDTIPPGFLKRVEITTGGSSAVYGSDAVAGVVNFILEDDFKGLNLDARYSTPEASGGEELQLEGLFGTRFADDRGFLMIGANYRNENAVFADSSRPLSILALEFDAPSTSSGDSFANEINTPGCDPSRPTRNCLLPSLSGSLPGGVFEGDAWFRDGQWFNDVATSHPSGFGRLPSDRAPGQDFYSDFDGINTRPGRNLLGEREILNLGLHGTFEFSEAVKASFTALYSDVDTSTRTGFESSFNGDTFGLVNGLPEANSVRSIAANSPFIPPEVEVTRSGSVSWSRAFPEVGEGKRINDRKTLRLMADLDGELTEKVKWNAFATYGKWKQVAINPGDINLQNLDFALDIESDGAGGFRCRDAGARNNGCVPINLFGEGSVSPEAANYIAYTGNAAQSRTQFTTGAAINGDLIDWGDRTIRFALGAEYRREGQNVRGDRDGDLIGGVDGDPTTNDVFVTTLSTFPSLRASYDVVEAFAEVDVPVIPDKLNVTAAARIGEYSTVGTIFSFNVGGVWEVNDALRFRTQFARAQRAPTISEFFSPPRPDGDDVRDPCDGLLPNGSGIVAPTSPGGENADLARISANCLADPGIQAFFANPDNAGDSFDTPSTVQGPNAGNPNLREETAQTFTAGFVLTPRIIPNFSIVADYYRISISNAIGEIETQNVVDLCYSAEDYPNNRFCNVITRNPFDGIISEVINVQENLNSELVEGIDATVNWDRIIIGFIPGQFDVNFRYSHYLTGETKFVGVGGKIITQTALGEIDVPRDELRLRAGYRNGGFRLTYTLNFEAGGVDSLEASNPNDDRFFRVSNQTFHDLFVRYSFGNESDFQLYAGVNNMFDNFGPLVPSGTDSGSSLNIVNGVNRALGREFFAGIAVNF